MFNERANCSLPRCIKKKGNTRMRTRIYWWVSRSLLTARKIAFVLWVRTWKKIVANDRARINHQTLKFRGPVGLGGMNKWWKNELLKEHWPKSWMCSSHVVMVCYCCWSQWRRESVCPAQKMCKEETERAFAQPFKLRGKAIRVVWLKSSSLDENIKSKPQRQNDSLTK